MVRRALAIGVAFVSALAPLATVAEERAMVIFLHNAWYETHKNGEPHPKFGTYDLAGIVAALGAGETVRAPERGPNADVSAAADALVAEIRAEIAAGADPASIKVIGASKGATIAHLASARLGEPMVKWVLVGGCHAGRMRAEGLSRMTGRVLSIYDTSDTVAPACAPYGEVFAETAVFEEIALSTGKNHGFQFTPDPAWIVPARDW